MPEYKSGLIYGLHVSWYLVLLHNSSDFSLLSSELYSLFWYVSNQFPSLYCTWQKIGDGTSNVQRCKTNELVYNTETVLSCLVKSVGWLNLNPRTIQTCKIVVSHCIYTHLVRPEDFECFITLVNWG
jgi:hypothetical protein